MRAFLFMAAFAALLVPGQVSAQHGGGHASGGGGHGGMGSHGGFSSHSSGGGFSGTHSGSGFGAHSFSGPGSRQSFSSSSRGYGRYGGPRIRTYGRGYGYGYRGGYGFPWLYGGLYDPYWWWDSGSSFDYDQQYQTGLANEMNAQSLNEQRMRQQDDQDVYARSAPPPPREQEGAEVVPATVLVFRDEHKQEIRNYAIVGQTLWNFAPQHTQKIPLSDIDLPATTKANDERGVDFRLPSAPEGQ